MTNEEILLKRYGDTKIDLAIVLGSGLAGLINSLAAMETRFSELDGFPHGGVSGHNPILKIGELEGRRVAILGGRQHYYEQGRADAMREPIRTLQALGVKRLLLTNAAGSLDENMTPGSIMLLNDHINMSGTNPLIGEASDARFVPLTQAYDLKMRQDFQNAAKEAQEILHEGVYVWWSGPSFETPAEIRMLRMIGGNAVGMSTVPEVILSRFYGLDVAAISVVTNMAAGMSDENISHEHTKEMAPTGAKRLERVLRKYLRALDA